MGRNGSGKSTLFDVFGFLKDAMTENVTVALNKRGGYKEVVSRNSNDPIEFEIKFREEVKKPLVTYFLQKYAPWAIDRHDFFNNLRISKFWPYPKQKIDFLIHRST